MPGLRSPSDAVAPTTKPQHDHESLNNNDCGWMQWFMKGFGFLANTTAAAGSPLQPYSASLGTENVVKNSSTKSSSCTQRLDVTSPSNDDSSSKNEDGVIEISSTSSSNSSGSDRGNDSDQEDRRPLAKVVDFSHQDSIISIPPSEAYHDIQEKIWINGEEIERNKKRENLRRALEYSISVVKKKTTTQQTAPATDTDAHSDGYWSPQCDELFEVAILAGWDFDSTEHPVCSVASMVSFCRTHLSDDLYVYELSLSVITTLQRAASVLSDYLNNEAGTSTNTEAGSCDSVASPAMSSPKSQRDDSCLSTTILESVVAPILGSVLFVGVSFLFICAFPLVQLMELIADPKPGSNALFFFIGCVAIMYYLVVWLFGILNAANSLALVLFLSIVVPWTRLLGETEKDIVSRYGSTLVGLVGWFATCYAVFAVIFQYILPPCMEVVQALYHQF